MFHTASGNEHDGRFLRDFLWGKSRGNQFLIVWEAADLPWISIEKSFCHGMFAFTVDIEIYRLRTNTLGKAWVASLVLQDHEP